MATPAATADTNKLFSMFEYYYNVNYEYIIPNIISLGGISSTANIRENFLSAYPEIAKVSPTISNVQLMSQGGVDYVTAQVFNETAVELRVTTSSYNSKFTSSVMYDNGTNGDLVAGDHLYTAVVPFQTGNLDVKFYVRANNNDATKLNPERAEYEFYIYNKSLSVASQSKNAGYIVYPNTTNSFVTIKSDNELITSYSLFNILGEEVLSENVSQFEVKVDLSNLMNGVYVLRANDRVFRVVKE